MRSLRSLSLIGSYDNWHFTAGQDRNITCRRGKNIDITSPSGQLITVSADGEAHYDIACAAEILPGGVELVVPREILKQLALHEGN